MKKSSTKPDVEDMKQLVARMKAAEQPRFSGVIRQQGNVVFAAFGGAPKRK